MDTKTSDPSPAAASQSQPMTDAERQLAQLRFYREVATAELDAVQAVRTFLLHLPETLALGNTADQARVSAACALERLQPLLNGAVLGMSAQIEAIDASLQPPPAAAPIAQDPAAAQSGATSEEAKAAADQVATDQAQPAVTGEAGANAV